MLGKYAVRAVSVDIIINDFVLGETASLGSWEQFYFIYCACLLKILCINIQTAIQVAKMMKIVYFII